MDSELRLQQDEHACGLEMRYFLEQPVPGPAQCPHLWLSLLPGLTVPNATALWSRSAGTHRGLSGKL